MLKENICKEVEYICNDYNGKHLAKFTLSFEIYEGPEPVIFENLAVLGDNLKENEKYKKLFYGYIKIIVNSLFRYIESMHFFKHPLINLKIVLSDFVFDEDNSVGPQYKSATENLLRGLLDSDVFVKVNK